MGGCPSKVKAHRAGGGSGFRLIYLAERREQEVVKSPLVKGLGTFRVCPGRMLLCSHTASRRVDGEGGMAQIRDRLLTSVQGPAAAFVGVFALQCVVQRIVGAKEMQKREKRERERERMAAAAPAQL